MFDSIGKALKGAVANTAGWIGGTIGGAVGGPTGAAVGKTIGQKLGGLFEKKVGGRGDFELVDTGVQAPSLGAYTMRSSYQSGKGTAPDVRMKTVDAETLNAEWEYRLTKGLRNRDLFR